MKRDIGLEMVIWHVFLCPRAALLVILTAVAADV
jgi:hypothetical protein